MSGTRNNSTRKGSLSKPDSSKAAETPLSQTEKTSKKRGFGSASSEKALANVSFGSVDKAVCDICKQLCKEGDKAVECEMCERWFHKDCQNVSDKLFEVLEEDSRSGAGIVH